MKIAALINTHKNSEIFREALDSIRTYLSKDIFVLIDGSYSKQFDSLNCNKIYGFRHGENISEINHSLKTRAPHRNVALGLMKIYEAYKDSVDWYCYFESDCLITSDQIKYELNNFLKDNYWVVGNDVRSAKAKIKSISYFLGKDYDDLRYCLGCCVFYSSKFIKKLYEDNFFNRFLEITNFYSEFTCGFVYENTNEQVYDLSEYLYPTLAHYYGGKIKELNCWDKENNKWKEKKYLMRFKPEISDEDPYLDAYIVHPIKDISNPILQYYKNKRSSFYI